VVVVGAAGRISPKILVQMQQFVDHGFSEIDVRLCAKMLWVDPYLKL